MNDHMWLDIYSFVKPDETLFERSFDRELVVLALDKRKIEFCHTIDHDLYGWAKWESEYVSE